MNKVVCDQCGQEIIAHEDQVHIRCEVDGKLYFKDLHKYCFEVLMNAGVERIIGGQDEGEID